MFISTKKYEPSMILALRAGDQRHPQRGRRLRFAGERAAEMQANVRNQMYLTSETLQLMAKSGPKMSAEDTRIIANYKGLSG